MGRKAYLGIDIGTSGIRCNIFDIEGNQIGFDYMEYPTICTEKGMLELEPNNVFKSLLEVVGNSIAKCSISSGDIRSIGISSQMHSFLAVDKDGNNLTNVITWGDTRSMDEAKFIEQNYDCGILYRKTGCRVQHPMYPLSNILWVKNKMKELFKNTYKFVTIKEFIVFKLSGEFVIDVTDASATGCLNINNFKWDRDILKDILKINEDKFGAVKECTYMVKGIKKKYAGRMGIKTNTPLVIGSGDGIMANIGCGGFDDTSMSCTIGTSGALRIAVDKPLFDEQGRTWCYCFTKDKWISGGAINNGGIVLKYFRNQFREQFEKEALRAGYEDIYDLFSYYASQINPGSDGLTFLPFLTGERAPGWNADATGTLLGLRFMHSKKHIIRAGMESVIYNMYSIYKMIEKIDGNVEQIIANGGYANSDVWLQIQADIFNKEIAVAGVKEASVLGAAYTGMVSVGDVKNFKQPVSRMKPLKVIKPKEKNVVLYREMYSEFLDNYSAILGKKLF
ncbi:gluconokinase [Clostridium luticellarii]|uniref:Xylulose kinase n=1 Tax=Clostridium luticellarii TaxID=1691940 RepID=A0A2T0BMF2_9CLOT|nr:gluconokinase [Clostridium luticellarii]MCI1944985.1 gluconokinase [Clostridium luticellarii]MCI1967865.1 gluconokinase [Clostridium luticellarii]MCI1995765.1 gluconokinase [Clostridium luticellarii]MCI2040740.1 gluconokinase [Clostridium luticellarii]PRR85055.1 Xylulose kinase [Clostridium luticellarii]